MTADTEYEIIIYRKGTAGTATHTYAGTSSIVSGSRQLVRNENNIAEFSFSLSNATTTATQNYLSSSFAGWSGGVTGALQLGDYVRYSLYPTSIGVKTQVFYGKIVELNPTKDGQLQVRAQDYLKVYDRAKAKLFYAGYRDLLAKTATWTDGAVVISGIADSNVVVPFASVQLVDGDARLALGGSTDWDYCDNGLAVAQSFYAPGEAIFGVEVTFYFGVSYDGTNLTVTLRRDDNGLPGQVLAIKVRPRPISLPDNIDFDFTTAGAPVLLENGQKYWIQVEASFVGGPTVGVRKATGSYLITSYQKYNGITWATIASKNLHMNIDTASLGSFDGSQYVYDSGSGAIAINNGIPTVTPTQSYVTPVRGIVSYFYGTITLQTICNALLSCSSDRLSSASSASMTETFGTFSTQGKKLLTALQEAADVVESSGAWSGYQHSFAHYESGGLHYVGFGKRLKTSDASAFTFSFGLDGVSDDEHRIKDFSKLKMRTDLRPSSFFVLGKDPDGKPLALSISDKSLAASFENQMEGFTNLEKIVDDNLVKLVDVWTRGNGAMDQYKRSVWEGQIIVSGVYPDLFDLTPASATIGSGKIITLNISPLGIVVGKFKVRGICVKENETEMTISNLDFLAQNIETKVLQKGDRTEAFLSPVGFVDNVYFNAYVASAVNDASLYMQLEDSVHNPISNLVRVLCTKFQSATYNANVYHAEFERDNGFSTPPYGIGYIRLYTAANGGTLRATATLWGAGAPVYNEAFDKFKTMRLIVDVQTKVA